MPLNVKSLFGLPPIKKLLVIVLAEFVASWCLSFFGCASFLQDHDLLKYAIAWGSVYGSIVQVFGPVCGAHLNPGVTIVCICFGSISIPLGLMYILVQFLGNLAGYATLYAIVNDHLYEKSYRKVNDASIPFCAATPSSDSNGELAMGAEFFGSLFVYFTACAAHDYRHKFNQDSMALKVAAVYTTATITTFRTSAASLNTARWFGPAVVTNEFTDWWAYWVGPLVASIIAPLFYLFICLDQAPPPLAEEKEAAVVNLIGALKDEAKKTAPPPPPS